MRARARLLVPGLCLGVSITLGAQAPHITERGDPSIASDTIYRLAVDSAKYPEQATVLLFDDGVMTFERDGRGTRTYRQVTQVLRQRAVQGLQERRFTYDPDHQRLTINWMRVLKPDGEIISAKPSLVQESDMPAAQVNPVYEHRKVLRLSLSGVAPGTIVDASWTTEERKPDRAGDFYMGWRVTAGTTVRRSRLLIDTPRDMALHIVEHHLDFPRRDTVVGSRKVYLWTVADIPRVRPEAYAPPADSNDLAMNIDVAASGTWQDIGHWYAGLAADRLHPDQRLRDTVRGVVAHATTFDDSVRAVHRWVAQDIRYISIALGQGGYQPRFPDTVLATGFGDCKDKASLLIASLNVLGLDAYPVLINALGRPDSLLPTIRAFNHEIVAIKRPTGYQYVDPTSSLSRLETLPPTDAGKFALIVRPDGTAEEISTPPDPVDSNRSDSRMSGVLADDGTFSGRVVVHGSGVIELGMRAAMQIAPDSTQRAAMLRRLASSVFPDAKGDSLVLFDGKDFHAKPAWSFVLRKGRATQQSGDVDILTLGNAGAAFTRIADEIEAHTPRLQPIDASRILPAATFFQEGRITLPADWHARLPANVSAISAFGQYEATYRQDGRDLVITHRTMGVRGIFPKERVTDLVAWLRECAKDRVPFIVIEHAKT